MVWSKWKAATMFAGLACTGAERVLAGSDALAPRRPTCTSAPPWRTPRSGAESSDRLVALEWVTKICQSGPFRQHAPPLSAGPAACGVQGAAAR
jgi:hypothetical protein